MRITIILISLVLSGCATTDITSFSDPDFQDKRFESYVVVTPNINLEYSVLLQKKVCQQIESHDSTCVTGLDLFPPTRDFTAEDKSKILEENNIQAYFIIYYGGGGTESRQIASLAYGTANVYGSSVTASGMSTPVYSFNRRGGYSLVLVDTASFKKAWVGGANVHASGMANITDEVFTSSLSEKIAFVLKKSNHL